MPHLEMPKVKTPKRYYEIKGFTGSMRLERPPETTHTIYTEDDFTEAEKARNNPIFLAVVKHKRAICKCCGATGTELFEKYCK